MAQRKRILLLIPHLGGGGAEQVIALLAARLSPVRYEVHVGVVTQADTGNLALPSSVVVHALGARRVRSAALSLLRLIRAVRPDAILSGMAHLNFLVLLLRPFIDKRIAVLARQNGTASATPALSSRPLLTRLGYRILYPRADRIVCQTEAMAADLVRLFRIPCNKLCVALNPVDVDTIRSRNSEGPLPWTGHGPHLLALGRLAPEKGFDILLLAIARAREQYPRLDLTIAGSGAEEAALRAFARALNLEDAVRFTGHINQPSRLFPAATLFVLSSRFEGLPNALLEAAAAGLPIVSTPASQGLVDLLRGRPGVWLTNDISPEALTAALLAALATLRPGQRFPHPFIEPFSLQHSIPLYEGLIDEVIKDRRP